MADYAGMIHRAYVSGLAACLLAAWLGVGCGKSSQPHSPAEPVTASTNLALQFHWIGKESLAARADATNFMAIWNLPESVMLEAQTLDKLATAPWRLWATNVSLSNAPSAQLRPLLEDLLQEEFYLEARGATNQASEFVLAIRLSSARAALWQSNLPTVLMSLFPNFQLPTANSKPPASGSDFRLQTSGFRLELGRSGDWTLFAISLHSPAQASGLLAATRSRITTAGQPFVSPSTNDWVALKVDARKLAHALGQNWNLPDDFPELQLEAVGDGENVRTKAVLTFPGGAPFTLQKWNIPTNLIPDPVISFTAIQGASYWLRIFKDWNEPLLGNRPQQGFLWALPGHQVRSYFAFPAPDATNRVQRWVEAGLGEGNRWLESHAIGKFVAPPRGGLGWQGVPFSSPFVLATTDHQEPYVFGGFFPVGSTNRPMSSALLEVVLTRTNLVYYDWEVTKTRMEHWSYMGQLMRVVFQKAQLVRNSPGLLWLSAISTNQTTAATVATLDSPREISVVRRSTLGLTAFELQLLTDWLESPQFPLGLHTKSVPPEMRLRRHAVETTNAPAATP